MIETLRAAFAMALKVKHQHSPIHHSLWRDVLAGKKLSILSASLYFFNEVYMALGMPEESYKEASKEFFS